MAIKVVMMMITRDRDFVLNIYYDFSFSLKVVNEKRIRDCFILNDVVV